MHLPSVYVAQKLMQPRRLLSDSIVQGKVLRTFTVPWKVGDDEVIIVVQISGEAHPCILVSSKTVKHDYGFFFIVPAIREVDDFAKAQVLRFDEQMRAIPFIRDGFFKKSLLAATGNIEERDCREESNKIFFHASKPMFCRCP